MPFSFYYLPYLVYTLRNYSPVDFYQKLIEMFSYVSSGKMLWKRLRAARSLIPAGYAFMKTLGTRQMINRLSAILALLKNDKQSRAFHEHETEVLPEFYHRQYENLLGPYAALMSPEDRKPILVSHVKHKPLPPAKEPLLPPVK